MKPSVLWTSDLRWAASSGLGFSHAAKHTQLLKYLAQSKVTQSNKALKNISNMAILSLNPVLCQSELCILSEQPLVGLVYAIFWCLGHELSKPHSYASTFCSFEKHLNLRHPKTPQLWGWGISNTACQEFIKILEYFFTDFVFTEVADR